MADSGALAGRRGVLTLFTDCLRRQSTPRDLPIVGLLGVRGSGKTWTLRYLEQACGLSVAIPYTFLDCTESSRDSVWSLVCDIADTLHRKWPEFGALDFPRVTLARLAVRDELPGDLATAREQVRQALAEAAKLAARGETLQDVVIDLTQAVDFSPGLGSLAGRAVRWLTNSKLSVDRLYHKGLSLFAAGGDRLAAFDALINLNRAHHDDRRRAEADRVLVKALLADLNAAFTGRRRAFHCAVLLDNCDTDAAVGLLNLVAGLRASTSEPDPLVLVAACGTVPGLTGLTERWLLPWEAGGRIGPVPIPDADAASYAAWTDGRPGRNLPSSWWLPVHLRDLALTELDHHTEERTVFVHRLTCGHPWSVDRVSSAAAAQTGVLTRSTPDADYLFRGFSAANRRTLAAWAAARDLETAARVIGGGLALHDEVVRRMLLVKGGSPRKPVLHPWFRRVLLFDLAQDGDRWRQTHGRLAEAAGRLRQLDFAYHHLACENLTPAVDYLGERFHSVDAETWIAEFDEIADAPGRHETGDEPVDRCDKLQLRDDRDRDDILRNALWSMTAARWIWADPVADPGHTLADTIADGFVRLAEVGLTGLARYRREAKKYRELGTR
ncbi:MAG: hypothetical protein ACRDRH_10580 [Pseudonocardia sp.]